MKTKASPSVSQTIKITLEGKTFELSKAEAERVYDGLEKALNITKPVGWPHPIVIERNIYTRPYQPPYWERCQTWCDSNAQSANGGTNRIFNLTH